ncbi:MAG: DUF421 domain-containing protein [Sedimentibacter sp.]|uniref:DUF421 domain-containing protein n=1 Tax=Sedimentibacter sp. TaxID=1960295 RepID=UPI002980E195|nr:DUF421 domain-containing protein [Sedimentibacter sp.]MDW5299295.1 DUF421 domain-containing protein [Sedimentibacter sp.]
MIIVAIRAVILYGILLVAMRIMGKGELGELQPFDLVVSLMLAELAVMPVEDLGAPLVHGFVAIAVIMFLQCFISYVTLKNNYARKIICGTPTIIIDHGKFNTKDMNKLRINVNDVLGQMRLKGYYSIENIDYLIMETNGEMSIIAPDDYPGTRCERIPIATILDGQIMKNNLSKYNISMDDLQKELNKNNIKSEHVLYGFIDEQNKFVFYKR